MFERKQRITIRYRSVFHSGTCDRLCVLDCFERITIESFLPYPIMFSESNRLGNTISYNFSPS